MAPTLRGLTIPFIMPFAPKRRDVILEEKKFTSINDSEVLMTSDNNTVVWTMTKQDCDSAGLGLNAGRHYLPVNWQIIKQSIIDVVIPANPSQDNRR